MKRLSFTLVIPCVFSFATMASGEVLRSHSRQQSTDLAVVPEVSTVSTTTPKLTGREKRAEAATAVAPAPAVVDAAPLMASVTAPKLTAREKRAAAAAVVAPASAVVDAVPLVANVTAPKLTARERRAAAAAAPVVEAAPVVVVPSPLVSSLTAPRLTGREIRAQAAAAASALTDVPPLFLPVASTPEVSTLDASGERTGRRFQKTDTVVSTPDINLNPIPFRAVPEPASTSLVLIGLFGTGMFLVRRYQARQA